MGKQVRTFMVQVADRGTAGSEAGDGWRSHTRRGSSGSNQAGFEWLKAPEAKNKYCSSMHFPKYGLIC